MHLELEDLILAECDISLNQLPPLLVEGRKLAWQGKNEAALKKLEEIEQVEKRIKQLREICELIREEFKNINELKIILNREHDAFELLNPARALALIHQTISVRINEIFPDLANLSNVHKRAAQFFINMHEYIRTGYEGFMLKADKIVSERDRAEIARLKLRLYTNPEDQEAQAFLDCYLLTGDERIAAFKKLEETT